MSANPGTLRAKQARTMHGPAPFTCFYCAAKVSRRQITFDHVVPTSKGGDVGLWNMVPACQPCNSAKADRMPAEAEYCRAQELIAQAHARNPQWPIIKWLAVHNPPLEVAKAHALNLIEPNKANTVKRPFVFSNRPMIPEIPEPAKPAGPEPYSFRATGETERGHVLGYFSRDTFQCCQLCGYVRPHAGFPRECTGRAKLRPMEPILPRAPSPAGPYPIGPTSP